jgi:arabinofuranosyltransferase
MFASNDAREPVGPGRFVSLPALIAILIGQLALTLALAALHRHALVDDAFISFRYADRWAHGLGWTWNDGAKVEGFSNPLWTYALGVMDRFAHVPPHRAAFPLGTLCAVGATFLVWLATGRRMAPQRVRLLITGMLALDVGLGVWTGSGLETALAALCVACVAFLSARPLSGWRHGFGLGLAALLMTLSRPEGVFWGVWTAIWLVWGAWVSSRVLVGFALGWSPAILLFAHRSAITGSALPNPFFAKLEPSFLGAGEGFGQLGGWMIAHAAWLLLLLFGMFRHRWRSPEPAQTDRWWLLLVGLCVGEAAFQIAAGGDWMGRTRYLAPMLPAVYLLGAEALRGSRERLPLSGVLAVLLLHGGLGWGLRDEIQTYTREGETLGRWLALTAAPGDTIATTASGAIPYFSGRTTIDVLGLNDPLVRFEPPRHRGAWAPGHHRYDIERLLDQAPQWIVWDFGVAVNRHRMQEVRDSPPSDASRLDYRRELFAHGKFTALYDIDTNAPPETQRAYTVFRRRE